MKTKKNLLYCSHFQNETTKKAIYLTRNSLSKNVCPGGISHLPVNS